MINVEPARSGHPILRKDGRFLGSRIDPVREGELWVTSCESRVGDAPVLIVLGLGCGYHVRALRKRYIERRIVVIEADPDVVAAVARVLPDLDGPLVSICSGQDYSRLMENESLRGAVHGLFRVLRHAPSCQGSVEYYQNLEIYLLARDRLGLELQLGTRPELARALDMRKFAALPGSLLSLTRTPQAPPLISVNTILALLAKPASGAAPAPAVDHAVDREILFWRILGELVK